jgi:hypothetical protein
LVENLGLFNKQNGCDSFKNLISRKMQAIHEIGCVTLDLVEGNVYVDENKIDKINDPFTFEFASKVFDLYIPEGFYLWTTGGMGTWEIDYRDVNGNHFKVNALTTKEEMEKILEMKRLSLVPLDNFTG